MKNLLTSSVAMTSPDKFQAEVETSELPAKQPYLTHLLFLLKSKRVNIAKFFEGIGLVRTDPWIHYIHCLNLCGFSHSFLLQFGVVKIHPYNLYSKYVILLQPPLANIDLGFRSSSANPSGPLVSFKRSNHRQHLLRLQTQGESKNQVLSHLLYIHDGVILPPTPCSKLISSPIFETTWGTFFKYVRSRGEGVS